MKLIRYTALYLYLGWGNVGDHWSGGSVHDHGAKVVQQLARPTKGAFVGFIL